ncbi:hypothetical protein GCM10023213_33880 [Prosthecobacter algae]|uniref:Uncharacterized protein n=1 Tax=Prosthecobacter algae TaxID=1144682 RepID=A0ABP9PC09_9BACT
MLFAGKGGGFVLEVVGVDEGSSGDGLGGAAHDDAVHGGEISRGKVAGGELVLGMDRLAQDPLLAVQGEGLPGRKILEGNDEIISGMDAEQHVR